MRFSKKKEPTLKVPSKIHFLKKGPKFARQKKHKNSHFVHQNFDGRFTGGISHTPDSMEMVSRLENIHFLMFLTPHPALPRQTRL